MALTPKQNLFVKEYLVDLNATQAAIRAGYSPKTAEAIGYENLRKPQIADAIAEHTQKKAHKLEITVENVLQDILDNRLKADSAMANISDMKPTDVAALINAKGKCNDQLGKYLAMFTDRTEHSGDLSLNIKWEE